MTIHIYIFTCTTGAVSVFDSTGYFIVLSNSCVAYEVHVLDIKQNEKLTEISFNFCYYLSRHSHHYIVTII